MKNMKMNHAQSGFTLIELMIVVAIIGILAAIAIPQYQDYIARTQVTRVVGEVSALKTAIEEELMRGGDPSAKETGSTAADNLEELGWVGSDLVSTALDVAIGDTGAGDVTATLDGNVSSGLQNAKIILNRTAEGVWTCEVDGTGAAAFKESFAPAGCPAS